MYKLYIYDEKHEQVNGELYLGEITILQKNLVTAISDFLDTNEITTRYKRLVLAKGYTQTYPEGESLIEFDY